MGEGGAGELGRGRTGVEDGTGALQTLDDEGIEFIAMVFVNQRAVGGDFSLDRRLVLDGNGDAFEGTQAPVGE